MCKRIKLRNLRQAILKCWPFKRRGRVVPAEEGCDQDTEPEQDQKRMVVPQDQGMVSLSEAEGRHQRGLETIDSEKADRNKHVLSLRKKVQALEENLLTLGDQAFELERERDELKDECERQREEHTVLQSEHMRLVDSLKLEKVSLKVSLSEAEGRYQRSLETIGQLESEKSDLNQQVRFLTKKVQDLQETLLTLTELTFKSQRERDEIKDDRRLSAQERRRLKLSRENQIETDAPAVRRASCDVASLNAKQTDQPDCLRPASVAAVPHKVYKAAISRPLPPLPEDSPSVVIKRSKGGDDEIFKHLKQSQSDQEEPAPQDRRLSARERRRLKLSRENQIETDAPASCDVASLNAKQESSLCNSAMMPEIKLNRKYRDTLMLHGKSREGEHYFHPSDFHSDESSGAAKIRRAVEHLRTDVIKGLGVKLLHKVLDIMQEEDEDKREVLLREQMGEEKYKTYAFMVRQLKFFEDVAFKS